MDLKDKLVTLEDLKVVYDKLSGGVDRWEDISSTLTWEETTIRYRVDQQGTRTVSNTAYKKAYKTYLQVTEGDIFKIFGWRNNYDPTDITSDYFFPIVLSNSSNPTTSPFYCYDFGRYPTRYTICVYGSTNIIIPSGISYMHIFDYAEWMNNSVTQLSSGEMKIWKKIGG